MTRYIITIYRGSLEELSFAIDAVNAHDVIIQASIELTYMFKNSEKIPEIDRIEPLQKRHRDYFANLVDALNFTRPTKEQHGEG